MAKKVLVIDDSRIARQQVIAALAGSEFEVVEAVDGVDGLAKVSEGKDLRLVICDVNMPGLNGLQVLEKVGPKTAPGLPPFLMLTSEAQPELIAAAKKHGAKAWMVKPVKPELLMAAVKKLAP